MEENYRKEEGERGEDREMLLDDDYDDDGIYDDDDYDDDDEDDAAADGGAVINDTLESYDMPDPQAWLKEQDEKREALRLGASSPTQTGRSGSPMSHQLSGIEQADAAFEELNAFVASAMAESEEIAINDPFHLTNMQDLPIVRPSAPDPSKSRDGNSGIKPGGISSMIQSNTHHIDPYFPSLESFKTKEQDNAEYFMPGFNRKNFWKGVPQSAGAYWTAGRARTREGKENKKEGGGGKKKRKARKKRRKKGGRRRGGKRQLAASERGGEGEGGEDYYEEEEDYYEGEGKDYESDEEGEGEKEKENDKQQQQQDVTTTAARRSSTLAFEITNEWKESMRTQYAEWKGKKGGRSGSGSGSESGSGSGGDDDEEEEEDYDDESLDDEEEKASIGTNDEDERIEGGDSVEDAKISDDVEEQKEKDDGAGGGAGTSGINEEEQVKTEIPSVAASVTEIKNMAMSIASAVLTETSEKLQFDISLEQDASGSPSGRRHSVTLMVEGAAPGEQDSGSAPFDKPMANKDSDRFTERVMHHAGIGVVGNGAAETKEEKVEEEEEDRKGGEEAAKEVREKEEVEDVVGKLVEELVEVAVEVKDEKEGEEKGEEEEDEEEKEEEEKEEEVTKQAQEGEKSDLTSLLLRSAESRAADGQGEGGNDGRTEDENEDVKVAEGDTKEEEKEKEEEEEEEAEKVAQEDGMKAEIGSSQSVGSGVDDVSKNVTEEGRVDQPEEDEV